MPRNEIFFKIQIERNKEKTLPLEKLNFVAGNKTESK